MKQLPLLLVLLCSVSASAELFDWTVAVVGKDVILHSDLVDLMGQKTSGSMSSDEALRILIEKSLLESECKKTGNYPVPAEVKQTIEEVKKQNGLDDKGLSLALQGMGMTFPVYESQLYFEMCKSRLIQSKIRNRVNISKDDIKRAYDQKGEDAEVQVHLRDMIFEPKSRTATDLSSTKQLATRALQSLRDGQKWDKVLADARKSNPKVSSADRGTTPKSELVTSIADSVFANLSERFTGPVETEEGFHVIEVLDKVQASKIPLVDVEKDLHKQLFEKEVERLLKQYIEELRTAAFVDILENQPILDTEKTNER